MYVITITYCLLSSWTTSIRTLSTWMVRQSTSYLSDVTVLLPDNTQRLQEQYPRTPFEDVGIRISIAKTDVGILSTCRKKDNSIITLKQVDSFTYLGSVCTGNDRSKLHAPFSRQYSYTTIKTACTLTTKEH